MKGDGSFQISLLDPSEASPAMVLAATPAPGIFVRWWAALLRRLLGRGKQERPGSAAGRTGPASAGALELIFRLSLTPGGVMAPMIEAMIKPVMVATAEDLAERIVAHLEERIP